MSETEDNNVKVQDTHTKKIEEQKRLEKERAEQRELVKKSFKEIKSSIAIQDLLEKIDSFMEYHLKIAKDRVGTEDKNIPGPDGTITVVKNIVRLSADEQNAELQRAAGIEEIKDYIDRQLK